MDNIQYNLYNYVFWYNPYESLWYAIQKDTVLQFFNGSRDSSKYFKSSQHSTLVEALTKPSLLQRLEGQ